jgi:guanylate kinase
MSGKHVWTVGLVALCGPTCGGKTSLASMLIEGWESVFAPLVTTTTRAPRPGERRDVDYHFVSRFEFEQYRARGWLIEADEIAGQAYGLQHADLQRLHESGRIGVVVLTPNGIAPIREACERLGRRLVSVYLGATREDLMVRLLQRYRADTEDSAVIYGHRLIHMLDEQPSWEWAAQYDIVENAYGDATVASVLERIQAQIVEDAVWVADDPAMRVTH